MFQSKSEHLKSTTFLLLQSVSSEQSTECWWGMPVKMPSQNSDIQLQKCRILIYLLIFRSYSHEVNKKKKIILLQTKL